MIMKKGENQQKETDMALSKDQEELYKRTMEEVRRQLDNLDDEVEKELQKVRRRLAELQKSLKMVYEGTAKLLGIEVEAEEEENGDSAAASAKM
jgi:hypothetical protein